MHNDISKDLPISLFGKKFPLSPHAKLNLRLEIVGRRDDGFHLLRMVNVLTTLHDEMVVEFVPELVVSCETTWDPSTRGTESVSSDDNLVCRAFRSFWEKGLNRTIPFGMKARLVKFIPSGAGLGGGSSDAASVLNLLRGLMAQSGLRISDRNFFDSALSVGSDVPYFCHAGIALVEGIGEVITPLQRDDLAGLPIILVIPPSPVSTPLAYRLYQSSAAGLKEDRITAISNLPLGQMLKNDFEVVVTSHFPIIGDALSVLKKHVGALAGMTGSGCAVFGVVPSEFNLNEVVTRVRADLPKDCIVFTQSTLS